MKALTLSIVIPAYNEETYLQACLAAIAQQSVAPDEVIVVDNNSTDNTAAIAHSFPFVKVITEAQQGLYFARQAGMNAAKSDIIARIDADTIIHRDWVSVVKTAFIDPTLHAMTGPFAYYDMPLPNISLWLDHMSRRIVSIGGYDFMSGANMAIRRNVWQLIVNELCNRPFLFEDIDMVLHLREHGIVPRYNRQMQAAMSSRRYADKPSDFLKYIGGHSRTHRFHNRPVPWGVHFAEGIFSFGYIALKPLQLSFDPVKRRPSLSYFLNRADDVRPDPMAVE